MRELLAAVADQCGLSDGTGAVGEPGFWRLGLEPCSVGGLFFG